MKDLERLEIKPSAVSHTSDWFAQIEKYAEQMIADGLAYADPSPQEEQQKGRYEKKNSPYRDTPPDESMRLWKEMHKGSEEGLKCCLRAKIDKGFDKAMLQTVRGAGYRLEA